MKNRILFLSFVIFLFCQNIFAQKTENKELREPTSYVEIVDVKVPEKWTYENKDSIYNQSVIHYSVTYEKQLTQEEKLLPGYLTKIVVTIKDGKLMEQRFGNEKNKRPKNSLLDYSKNNYYTFSYKNPYQNVAIMSKFGSPKKDCRLISNATKKIAGLECQEYAINIQNRALKLYTTKAFGLRFIKNHKVDGLLMEYTLFDENLGFFTIKAESVSKTNVSDSFFSLNGFYIKRMEDLRKYRVVSEKKRNETIDQHMHQECETFCARTIKWKRVSSKKIKKHQEILVLNFWNPNSNFSKNEIPQLNILRDQYKDNDNIHFVGITTHSKKEVKAFLRHLSYDYDLVKKGEKIADLFDIRAYPANIIIDQQGYIRFYEYGHTKNLIKRMSETIDGLL